MIGKHQEQLDEHLCKKKEEIRGLVNRVSTEGGLQDVGDQLSKQGQELQEKLSKRLSKGYSFFQEMVTPTSEQEQESSPSMGSFFSYLGSPSNLRQELGHDSAGPGAPDETENSKKSASSASPAEGRVAASGSTSAGSSASEETFSREGTNEELPPVAPAVPAVTFPVPPVSVTSSASSTKPAEEPAIKPVDTSSSLLIEVDVTLDDYTVQVLQLRAADRCKDAAARFIREHSLKAWFEQPLVKYLKETEENAEKFPVHLKADLMDIRRQYSSQKNAE